MHVECRFLDTVPRAENAATIAEIDDVEDGKKSPVVPRSRKLVVSQAMKVVGKVNNEEGGKGDKKVEGKVVKTKEGKMNK